MSGFEELKIAYERMRDECSFRYTGLEFDKYSGDTWVNQRLNFSFFGVGIKMSFSYDFITSNDPNADDIFFKGDPNLHFSIYCYRILVNFIETLQKYRTEKDTMEAFLNYLNSMK